MLKVPQSVFCACVFFRVTICPFITHANTTHVGILAHEFVGQGTAKSTSTYTDDPSYSSKGLTQADQARVLAQFNSGQVNEFLNWWCTLCV